MILYAVHSCSLPSVVILCAVHSGRQACAAQLLWTEHKIIRWGAGSLWTESKIIWEVRAGGGGLAASG